jgi:hypothetical protein
MIVVLWNERAIVGWDEGAISDFGGEYGFVG